MVYIMNTKKTSGVTIWSLFPQKIDTLKLINSIEICDPFELE